MIWDVKLIKKEDGTEVYRTSDGKEFPIIEGDKAQNHEANLCVEKILKKYPLGNVTIEMLEEWMDGMESDDVDIFVLYIKEWEG
jgi:hypothetical protein